MNIPIRTTQCYPNPNHFRSIVSDMNWVCEDAWVPAMSQVFNLSLFETNFKFLTYLCLKPMLCFQLETNFRFPTYLCSKPILCLQSIFFLGAVPGMLFFGWFWWVFDLQIIVNNNNISVKMSSFSVITTAGCQPSSLPT